jgi:hypothetical protein
MQKLRLDPEKLTVESFQPSRDATGRGTAHGYQDTCSCQPTCGIASRGQEGYAEVPPTRYACCI